MPKEVPSVLFSSWHFLGISHWGGRESVGFFVEEDEIPLGTASLIQWSYWIRSHYLPKYRFWKIRNALDIELKGENTRGRWRTEDI